MNLLIEKYNHWVKNPYNGEVLFFWGFILYIFWKILRTTMFSYSEMAFQICLILSIILLAAKIFLFDIYSSSSYDGMWIACSSVKWLSMAIYMDINSSGSKRYLL